MRTQFDMDLSRYFFASSPADVRRRLREAASAVGLEKMEYGSKQFVDVMLGRYICRRLPLPCQRSNCVTSEDVVLAADEASSLTRRVGELESSRKLHVVEANAIVNDLVDTLKRRPRVTLHPLLTVLGIRHQLQGVHYGSRLAFEVYERKSYPAGSEKKLLIRVVYDGVDRTHEISFCRPLDKNHCPANRFKDFAEQGLFDIVAGLRLSQICSA